MKKKLIYSATAFGLAAAVFLIWKKNQYNRWCCVPVVDNFDLQRFVGKWYEIARIENSNPKKWSHTTTHFSFNEDNSVKVVKRGYNMVIDLWEEVKGKARFARYDSEGRLKVCFFGPFYNAYNILSIDDDYQHALIFGKDTNFLWILSRQREIPNHIIKNYLQIAKKFGYDLYQIQWMNHQ